MPNTNVISNGTETATKRRPPRSWLRCRDDGIAPTTASSTTGKASPQIRLMGSRRNRRASVAVSLRKTDGPVTMVVLDMALLLVADAIARQRHERVLETGLVDAQTPRDVALARKQRGDRGEGVSVAAHEDRVAAALGGRHLGKRLQVGEVERSRGNEADSLLRIDARDQ